MSARAAARTSNRVARARAVEIDEDDLDAGDEDAQTTQVRARKAKARQGRRPGPMDTVTRVAVKNAPNRGYRGARSENDRGHNGRAATKRTAEFSEEEIKSFMTEEANHLPYVPDTADHHYLWMRTKLPSKGDDGSNIVSTLNGRMGYELVRGPDDLPPGYDLKPLRIKDGDYQDCYQFSDCVLVRCPMRNYKLSKLAGIRRAKQLNEMLDAGSHAAGIPGEERTGIIVEENRERTGVREADPDNEAEAV